MACLNYGRLAFGAIGNAVELVKMIHDDRAVPASLVVCVRVVLVRVGRFPLRCKEREVEIGTQTVSA
jgi:hypothetical protein